MKLLIASTRSAAHLKAWLGPLGLAPHFLDEPDLLKALSEEELKEARFACGHLTPESRKELCVRLREAKHKIAVVAHGLDDGWVLKTNNTDCLLSMSSGSYTAKVRQPPPLMISMSMIGTFFVPSTFLLIRTGGYCARETSVINGLLAHIQRSASRT